MDAEKTRKAIKIIMRIRSREKARGSRRSIEDLIKIGGLARLNVTEKYEAMNNPAYRPLHAKILAISGSRSRSPLGTNT